LATCDCLSIAQDSTSQGVQKTGEPFLEDAKGMFNAEPSFLVANVVALFCFRRNPIASDWSEQKALAGIS